jgi:hypothetical protein
MIVVTDIKISPDGAKARVSLFADEQSDVTSEAISEAVGMEVQPGSSVITADGDIAFMKSDGTWNWLE